MEDLLEVSHINCRYGDKVIVPDLSFTVQQGRIACLLGPSGCGKTTVLRAIAGFENIHAGTISLAGRCLSREGHTVVPEQRQVGMVFQDYALFPHLTVSENIGFGLQRQSSRERTETVDRLLALIQLGDHGHKYPHQLSGGQQQRVALARALAPSPRILLLDEPFSNLDAELRRGLSLEVRNILKQRGISAILVTHDQAEAFNVADDIGVLFDGALQQWDSPRNLFHHPVNTRVAGFVSGGLFIDGRVTGAGGAVTSVMGEVELAGAAELPAGAVLDLLIRPWNVVAAENGGCGAEIVQQQFSGAVSSTRLRLADGSEVESNDENLAGLTPGTRVEVALDPEHLLFFEKKNRESAATARSAT